MALPGRAVLRSSSYDRSRKQKTGQLYWDDECVYAHRVLNGEPIGFEQMTPRHGRAWFGPIQIAVFDEPYPSPVCRT